MPVVNFHLVEGFSTPEQDERLLVASCRLYAEVLDAPMERVRAFITRHAAGEFAVAGALVTRNGLHAPYFDFIVLEGRSLEQRQRLLAGFTALLVECIGAQRELVRGRCTRVEPQDWAIGGEPTGVLRHDEIAARRRAAPA